MRVKPGTYRDESGKKQSFVIRDPLTRTIVPPEGIDVSATDFFWDRLLRDGDVVLVDPVPAAADSSNAKTAAPAKNPA